MVSFKDWLFDTLPYYFRANDSYVTGGKGLLQRFLMAIGEEIDDNIIIPLTNLFNVYDAALIDEKLIVHLAEILGNPPDTFYDTNTYRRLLKYIPYINKYKGTAKGYEYLFRVLGVMATIEEDELVDYKYDIGHQYDTSVKYDSQCPPCSNYTLLITDADNNCPILADAPTDPLIYNMLLNLIRYVEPINARLTGYSYNEGSGADWWILTTGVWDDTKFWSDTKHWKDEP